MLHVKSSSSPFKISHVSPPHSNIQNGQIKFREYYNLFLANPKPWTTPQTPLDNVRKDETAFPRPSHKTHNLNLSPKENNFSS